MIYDFKLNVNENVTTKIYICPHSFTKSIGIFFNRSVLKQAIFCLSFFVSLMFANNVCAVLQSGTYYVVPGGSGAHDGSDPTNAWSLAEMGTAVEAGTTGIVTILLVDGVYQSTSSPSGIQAPLELQAISEGGGAQPRGESTKVIIRSLSGNREQVVIDSNNFEPTACHLEDPRYVEFRDLSFKASGNGDQGVRIKGASDHIKFINCEIAGKGHSLFFTGIDAATMTDIRFVNCDIHQLIGSNTAVKLGDPDVQGLSFFNTAFWGGGTTCVFLNSGITLPTDVIFWFCVFAQDENGKPSSKLLDLNGGGATIRNCIFYNYNQADSTFDCIEAKKQDVADHKFDSDYNLFAHGADTKPFKRGNSAKTFSDWQLTQFEDEHSIAVTVAPGFAADNGSGVIDNLYDIVNSSFARSAGTLANAPAEALIDRYDILRNTPPDIGYHQFVFPNNPPSVNDQGFSVNENAVNSTVPGTIVAADPDSGDTLLFSVTGGTGAEVFVVDAGTGEIIVVDSIQLDFEMTPLFTLDIEVTDTSGLTDSAVVTIDLNNINEAPIVDNQDFLVFSTAANGSIVGTIIAIEPDSGDSMQFFLNGGTGIGIFAINSTNGVITVADESQLTNGTNYTLDVDVEDSTGLISSAVMTITVVEHQKITASDGRGNDRFGSFVAIDGDVAVVGAPAHSGWTNKTGSAYVFHNIGGVWTEVTSLVPADVEANDRFGSSVAIDGNTIAVGARWENDKRGAVYLFYRDAGGVDNWGEVRKIIASDPIIEGVFGDSLGLDNDILVVGAKGKEQVPQIAGAAYVFYRDEGGYDNWGEVTRLVPIDPDVRDGDLFGSSVAINDDLVVVGAPRFGASSQKTSSGKVYVFDRDFGGANSWGQKTTLRATVVTAYTFFGSSVSIKDDIIAISSPLQNNGSTRDTGAVYLFEQDLGGPSNWGLRSMLEPPPVAEGMNFGRSVDIHQDSLIVGTPYDFYGIGEIYVYQRNEGGIDNWGNTTILRPADGDFNDQFGISAAVFGGTFWVGSYGNDALGIDSGAVYVFPAIP